MPNLRWMALLLVVGSGGLCDGASFGCEPPVVSQGLDILRCEGQLEYVWNGVTFNWTNVSVTFALRNSSFDYNASLAFENGTVVEQEGSLDYSLNATFLADFVKDGEQVSVAIVCKSFVERPGYYHVQCILENELESSIYFPIYDFPQVVVEDRLPQAPFACADAVAFPGRDVLKCEGRLEYTWNDVEYVWSTGTKVTFVLRNTSFDYDALFVADDGMEVSAQNVPYGEMRHLFDSNKDGVHLVVALVCKSFVERPGYYHVQCVLENLLQKNVYFQIYDFPQQVISDEKPGPSPPSPPPTTTSPTQAQPSGAPTAAASDSNTHPGIWVGIIIAVTAGMALLGAAWWWHAKRKRSQEEFSQRDPFESGYEPPIN